MEETQAVSTIGVGYVVTEFSQTLMLRTNVRIKRWANRGELQIIPVAISVGASSSVVTNNVVGVCDPDGCRCLVCIQ
jgi:hypothetical protein